MKRVFIALGIFLLSMPQAIAQAGPVDTYIQQAKSFAGLQRYSEAERAYLNALREADKLGSNSPRLPEVLDVVGEFYRSRGDYQKAEPYYLRELKLRESLWGRDALETATCHRELGLLYTYSSDYAKAQQSLDECLRIRSRLLEKAQAVKQMNAADLKLKVAECYDDLAQLALKAGALPLKVQQYQAEAQRLKSQPNQD